MNDGKPKPPGKGYLLINVMIITAAMIAGACVSVCVWWCARVVCAGHTHTHTHAHTPMHAHRLGLRCVQQVHYAVFR